MATEEEDCANVNGRCEGNVVDPDPLCVDNGDEGRDEKIDEAYAEGCKSLLQNVNGKMRAKNARSVQLIKRQRNTAKDDKTRTKDGQKSCRLTNKDK